MSRVAKKSITVPTGVEVVITAEAVSIKGPKGKLVETIPQGVIVTTSDEDEGGAGAAKKKIIQVSEKENADNSNALAGTTRANLQNMINGVSQGFEKSLELVGVGYRARVEGKTVHLSLGFSHNVTYDLIDGITAEAPSATQIIIKGVDKRKVGQVAAEIRKFRKPEPYKGKGVKYTNEQIVRKETKKK